MKSTIALTAMACAAGLIVGCAHKPTTNTQSPDLSAKAMSFDPEGSDSGNIPGLTTVHFDFNKASLTGHARSILNKDAKWIEARPNVDVQVQGNTDERGSEEYNLALGQRRANTVKRYLVSLGIASSRLSTISFGKERPLDPGHSEAAYAKNRRANLVPSMAVPTQKD